MSISRAFCPLLASLISIAFVAQTAGVSAWAYRRITPSSDMATASLIRFCLPPMPYAANSRDGRAGLIKSPDAPPTRLRVLMMASSLTPRCRSTSPISSYCRQRHGAVLATLATIARHLMRRRQAYRMPMRTGDDIVIWAVVLPGHGVGDFHRRLSSSIRARFTPARWAEAPNHTISLSLTAAPESRPAVLCFKRLCVPFYYASRSRFRNSRTPASAYRSESVSVRRMSRPREWRSSRYGRVVAGFCSRSLIECSPRTYAGQGVFASSSRLA